MKPLFVKVLFFDPTTEAPEDWAGYPVFDGIEVEIARIDTDEPLEGSDILTLTPDSDRKIFLATSRRYEVTAEHFLRVRFQKCNFSKVTKSLHLPSEVTSELIPIYNPARLPLWDSGWDDGYSTNEFFGDEGVKVESTADAPVLLKIPLRRIYVIGHRGAPYHFPENTIASFRKGLELGASGLEFDLCLTKDSRIVVFHDAEPDSTRILFEDFPYELVSPEFDGDIALIKEWKDGDYRIARKRRMWSGSSFDILKLTAEQVRSWYHYHHVHGVEYPVPSLEEFLTFVASETDKIRFLFFDVKNPRWDEGRNRKRYVTYGSILGRELRKYPNLPERLVVANKSARVLECLKEGLREAGEDRCEFAYDAAGSLGAMFGFKENPLRMANDLGNTVVSIGTRFRSGDLDEIIEATRDRDYNRESKLSTVIHWTINDPAHMYHSLVAGVNAILTDKPDVMRAVLERMGVYVGPDPNVQPSGAVQNA